MAVKGRGREEACVEHPDRMAVTRCTACHRPICAACVISTSDGKFCSRQCAARAADFRASKGSLGRKAGLPVVRYVKMIIGFIIFIFVLAAVNKYIFDGRLPIVGRPLRAVWFFGKKAADTTYNEARERMDDVGTGGDEADDTAITEE